MTGSGGTPPREKGTRYYDGGTIPWVKSGELRESLITDTAERITPAALAETSTKLVPSGAILLAMYGATIGRLGVLGVPAATNQAVCNIIPDPKAADARYVFHALHSQVDGLVNRGAGGAQPNISQAIVRDIQIPLPPVEEQRRIADILDQADELRAKRRVATEKLGTLTNSIFDEMFGRGRVPPVTVGQQDFNHRDGWRWERLIDVARLATGHTPDREVPNYWDGDIPWISLTEIRGLDGTVAESTKLRVSQAGIDHSSSVVLPAGTVCFSRTASIGFVTVMGRPMATSQDFVNWVCGDSLRPLYLMHALLRSREQLRSLSAGSTHKTIYMRVAEQFRVLVPPLTLQDEFVGRMDLLTRQRQRVGESASTIDHLFASLQHRAFRGEL